MPEAYNIMISDEANDSHDMLLDHAPDSESPDHNE